MSHLPSAAAIEMVLVRGDLSALTEEQRLSYYNNVCHSLGLNPLTKPFEYIKLNNKLVLYAKRDATDQLRKLYKVSVAITSRERLEDCYVVTAQASTPDGRTDESIGAVLVGNLKGEALANVLMKAETKAKRRVTLSICGMGILDETEIEDAQKTSVRAQVSFTEEPVEMPKILSATSHPEDEPPPKKVSQSDAPICCESFMMKSKFHEDGQWFCRKCKALRPIE